MDSGPNGANWFDIIEVQNVQNINGDVTDTRGIGWVCVSEPGEVYDVRTEATIF